MRRVRTTCVAAIRKMLCVLLSLLLMVQGAPLVGAYAVEQSKAIEVVESRDNARNDEQDNKDAQGKKKEKEESLAEDAKLDDKEPAYKSGSLTSKLTCADGRTYVVTVDYDEKACIPSNAELELEEVGESDLEDLRTRAELELDLQAKDRIMGDGYLGARIVADGLAVEPRSELHVTVETNAIKPSQSSSVEVVLLASEDVPTTSEDATPHVSEESEDDAEDEAVTMALEDELESENQLDVQDEPTAESDPAASDESVVVDELTSNDTLVTDDPSIVDDELSPKDELLTSDAKAEDEAPLQDEHVVPTNLTQQKNKRTKLSFQAGHLGTIALVNVVRRFATWKEPGLNVWLFGPRQELTLKVDDVAAPNLEDGLDALDCFRVGAEPSLGCGTTLWLEAQPTESDDAAVQADATAQDDAETIELVDEEAGEDEEDLSATNDERGGTFAYAVRDGELSRELFGPQGTTEPVAFRADKDSVLLAWDSGYRKATLTMRGVTVKGMLPEGTTGTARDVAKRLDDPAEFVGELDAQDQIDSGAMELKTVAAYDITLVTDGNEYEPDDDHPLMVTIANEGISADKQLMVWHILDDGTVETVDDFVVANGTIRFEAVGFSTYAVTELRATSTVPLSTNFTLKCIAKGYARSSVVTFVDEHFNPIMGTVTGTLTRSYTGVADGRNETNWIDLYSFADSLDPAIADEYDFSRVFLTLDKANTVQKDFRHIQVGDERNILPNGSTSLYRAYFHMTDISENAPGQAYHGTWYLLSNGGAMDNIFIEFYHVAPASFYALDTRGDPVAGAEFTLYSDHACTTPYEYKHEVVTATSNRRGLVSFGKIPRGTYYMKETLIPDGYKKTTKVRTVVVDGQTAIPNVIHEDDDGSVIVSEAKSLVFTKQWDESSGQDHAGYSVVVTVSLDDEVVEELTLNEQNHWTQTLDDLDPNQSYVITEKSVLNAQGTDVTQDWIPHIETEIESEEIEYKQADAFIKGKDYVMVAAGYALSGAGKPLAGDGTSLTPQVVTVSDDEIVSDVTDEMLWNVYGLTNDGVITLQNLGTHKYLDQNDSSALRWYQNPELPQFVRHVNTNGIIKIYFRRNLNNTSTIWLWMRGRVDRTQNANDVALFTIYRKLNTKTYDITITNKPTTYPIKMRSVSYPDAEPLPNVRYDLYTQAAFDQGDAEPLKEALVANEQGFLADDGSDTVSLSAGTYYMVRSSNDEGYAPEDPVKFTITRKGALRVKQADRAIPDFAYVSGLEEGNVSYPLLQLPSYKPATVKLTLEVEGQYADRTRQFGFSLGIPSGMDELEAIVNGVPTTLSQEEGTEFTLAHGQSVVLQNVPAALDYVITQTSARVAAVPQNNDALYHASVSVVATPGSQSSVLAQTSPEDARTITLANILGTADDPAKVTIVNALANKDVPATGLSDNEAIWSAIVVACGCALLASWLITRRARLRRRI